jgi:hypothetical protein
MAAGSVILPKGTGAVAGSRLADIEVRLHDLEREVHSLKLLLAKLERRWRKLDD